MKEKIIDGIINALYILGAIIGGAFGAFALWAILWICYDLGFKM